MVKIVLVCLVVVFVCFGLFGWEVVRDCYWWSCWRWWDFWCCSFGLCWDKSFWLWLLFLFMLFWGWVGRLVWWFLCLFVWEVFVLGFIEFFGNWECRCCCEGRLVWVVNEFFFFLLYGRLVCLYVFFFGNWVLWVVVLVVVVVFVFCFFWWIFVVCLVWRSWVLEFLLVNRVVICVDWRCIFWWWLWWVLLYCFLLWL